MNEQNNNLIQRAAEGDRTAFGELVMEHSPMVFRLAMRFMQEQALAEDISQDVFLKVYRSLPGFDRKSRFSTWLHRITVNTCIDALRKRQHVATHSDEDINLIPPVSATDCPAEQRDLRQQLLRAMKNLTDMEQAAFALRHYEGHSIREICEHLQINQNACKQAIFRAVHKMRDALTPVAVS